MSDNNDFREDAENHWKYTEKIIYKMLELVHIAYVEGMVHAYKHGKNDKQDGGIK